MAERRDIDDIKLTTELEAEEELELKESQLADDLGDLGDLDLDLKNLDDNPILGDDDFSDPPVSRRKGRKSTKGKSSITMMVLVPVVVILAVGGVFFALNKDALMRAISAEPAPAKVPLPVDNNVATTQVATDPTVPAPIDPATVPVQPIDEAASTDMPPQPDAPAVMPAVDPAQSQAPSDTALQPAPVVNPGSADVAAPAIETTEDDVLADAFDPLADGGMMTEEPVEPVPVAEANAPVSQETTPAPADAVVPPVATSEAAPADAPMPPQPTPDETVVNAAAPETAPADPAKDTVDAAASTTAAVDIPKDMDLDLPGEADGAQQQTAPVTQKGPPPLPPALPPGKFYEAENLVRTLGEQTKPTVMSSVDQNGRMTGVEVTMNNGQDMDAQIVAGSNALDLERYQAAYDIFDKLYQTNKSDERILMGRAVALQKLGRNAEAITAYDELLSKNPDSPEVMTNMLGLVRQQYPSEALQRLLDLRLRYPNNPVVAAQAGLANASVGNYEEGLRYLGIAAGLDPNNPKHFFNMAVIAERMGKPDAAVNYYERALEADAMASNPRNKLDRDMIYDRLSVLRQGK